MKAMHSRMVGVLAAGLITALVVSQVQAALPGPVKEAVQKAYPKARITEFEREREGGLACWEVELRQKRQEVELLVTEDGQILSIAH